MGRLFVVAALGVAFALSASAAQPTHTKETWGPFISDSPAGETCDFNLIDSWTTVANFLRFYDRDGSLVREAYRYEVSAVHLNDDTGKAVTEVAHYAVTLDYKTGESDIVGNFWHLRDEDGRIVLVMSGLVVTDLYTGELIRATPNNSADYAGILCPILGGAPAQ